MKKTTTPVKESRPSSAAAYMYGKPQQGSVQKRMYQPKSFYMHSSSAMKGSPTTIVDRVMSPKPEWNSLQNEDKLTSYKLTKEEIVRRKQLLMSKHNIFYSNNSKKPMSISSGKGGKQLMKYEKDETCLDLLSEDEMINSCSSDEKEYLSEGNNLDKDNNDRNGIAKSSIGNRKKKSPSSDRKFNSKDKVYSKEKYSLSKNMDFLQYSSSDDEEDGVENVLSINESDDENISRNVVSAATPLVDKFASSSYKKKDDVSGEITPADQKIRAVPMENASGIAKPIKKKKRIAPRHHTNSSNKLNASTYIVNRPVSSPPEPLWNLFDGYSTDDNETDRNGKSALNSSRASNNNNNNNTSHVSNRSQGIGDETSDLISIYTEIQNLRAELKYFEGLSGAASFLNMKELDTALDITDGSTSITIHKTMKFLTQLVCQTMTYLLKSEVDKDSMLKELALLRNASKVASVAPVASNATSTTATATTTSNGSLSTATPPAAASFYRPTEFDAYSSYLPASASFASKGEAASDQFSSVKEQMSGTSATDWLFKKTTGPAAPHTPQQLKTPSNNMSAASNGMLGGSGNKGGAVPMRIMSNSSDVFSIVSTDQMKASTQIFEPKKSNKATPEISSKNLSGGAGAVGYKGSILREPVQIYLNNGPGSSLSSKMNPFRQQSKAGESVDCDSGSVLDTSTSSNVSTNALKSSMDDYNNRVYDYIHRQGILASTHSNNSSPDRSHVNRSTNLDISGTSVSQTSSSNNISNNNNDTSMVDAYDDWMNRMTLSRTSAVSTRQNPIMGSPILDSQRTVVSANPAALAMTRDRNLDSIFDNSDNSDDDDDNDDDDKIEDSNSAQFRRLDDIQNFDDDDDEEDYDAYGAEGEEEEDEDGDAYYHKIAPVPFEAPRHPNSL